MASDLSATEPNDITKPDVSPVDRPSLPALPAQRKTRLRFVFIYGVLALALGAAVAGVVIYAGDVVHPGPAWSSWKPSGGGLGAAKQIAAHVSKQYHLPSGEQLVDVLAKPPSVSPSDQQIPIHYLAVRGKKQNGDQVVAVNNADTVQYSLCGLGDSCSIATGKPSVQRGTLVRREILELALYTFRYVGGVKNVIAFMPPTPGSTPKYAVYLNRDELSQQLHTPITKTLNTKTPLPNTISRKDQQTVDAATESRVYSFGLSQAQNGDAVLVLAPLPA
jgi:hypothetical protein